jgi:hypothetical protein
MLRAWYALSDGRLTNQRSTSLRRHNGRNECASVPPMPDVFAVPVGEPGRWQLDDDGRLAWWLGAV